MPVYLFNIQTTVEVVADNEEEAYDILNEEDESLIDVIDRDVLLVDVSE